MTRPSRRTLSLAALLGAVLAAPSALAQKIEFETIEINYGDIVKGANGVRQFRSKSRPASGSVTADAAAQGLHETGDANVSGALVVRRGSFVRVGVELSDARGCADAGLLLRDVASGRALHVPVLSRADGLGVTLANAKALAVRAAAQLDGVESACGWIPGATAIDLSSFHATLGGQLGGTLSPAAETYAERVATGGTPFYSVTVELTADPVSDRMRAALAVWLPEHMPVGAFELNVACGGEAVGSALPLLVLFNPAAPYTAEALAHAELRKAGLASSADTAAGPLRLSFGVDATDPAARDVALEMLADFPLSARAHPALVARIAEQGPMQLVAGVGEKGEPRAGRVRGIILWSAAQAWNDATGHFPLWSATGDTLSGRWAAAEKRVTVVGNQGNGVPRGLVGRWEYDETAGQDSRVATSARDLPKHTSVRVSATPHFVDDWQGETAWLQFAGTPIRFGQSKSSYTVGADDGGFFAKGNGGGRYGQCWVYASLAGAAPEGAASSSEIFARYRRDGGGMGQCLHGKCFCAAYVGDALLRNLGIPTRSMTNFDSVLPGNPAMPGAVGPNNRGLLAVASDGRGFAAWSFQGWVDRVIAAGGSKTSVTDFELWNQAAFAKHGESVWSFHVWSEAWVGRPAGGSGCGWSAFDATPQEVSEEQLLRSPLGADIARSASHLQGGPAVLTNSAPASWMVWKRATP